MSYAEDPRTPCDNCGEPVEEGDECDCLEVQWATDEEKQEQFHASIDRQWEEWAEGPISFQEPS